MHEKRTRSSELAIARAENESIELRMLTEALFLKYGYDFRDYARASLKRRVLRTVERHQLAHIADLMHKALGDRELFESLLMDLSVTVTEMFRDPHFFLTLRREVLPRLAEREHIRIWVAGCASGEEAYSLAIILREQGLAERARIYATDFNEAAIERARDGIVPLDKMSQYTTAYQRSGGTSSFSDYYHARYDSALLDAELRKAIVFSRHNLVTDSSFAEFDLIICRNVLIYFSRELQERVLGLFVKSMAPRAFLGLGSRESIEFSHCSKQFEPISREHRIYRRIGESS